MFKPLSLFVLCSLIFACKDPKSVSPQSVQKTKELEARHTNTKKVATPALKPKKPSDYIPPENAENTCAKDECVQVGLEFENGVGSDLVKANHAYNRGCKLGSMHACGSIGVMRFYGHGIVADPKEGLRELEKSCGGDYGEACANLGIIYMLGRGGITDNKKAKNFFLKGCPLGSKTACDALKELDLHKEFIKRIR